MYFANKRQLAEIGLPLICDNFKAWKYGPVPSFTGAVVKCLEGKEHLSRDMKIFQNALSVRKNKLVVGLESPNIDDIPAISRSILDSLINKYKYRSWKDISKESHDEAWFEAYHRLGSANDGRSTIRPHLMAAAAGAPDYMVDIVKRFFTKNDETYNRWSDSTSVKAYEKAVIEIRNLLLLEDDWDGEGAYAIDKGAAMNCHKFLELKRSHVEYISDIYPTPSGTICIDWNIEGNIVSAEISHIQIAFYCEAVENSESYDSPTMNIGKTAFDSLYEYIERFCKH